MVNVTDCLYRVVVLMILQSLVAESAVIYNVLSFGAKPNGTTDSTQAFVDAWSAACASNDSSTISVPKGRYLLPSAIKFSGDKCKTLDITFQIDGTLIASSDYRILGQANNWLSFERVTGVSIIGGTLDAKGTALWACKLAASTGCPNGATSLRFTNSKNISINGLTSLNSQMFHIVKCCNFNTSIKTGDDCVSIGPGMKDLWVEQISCGPGHGISIGSLAKDLEEEGVQNVTVRNAIFKGTQNGLRIKSWPRPSSGFVQGVQFIDAVMLNVQNPIVIDQNYCPRNINCPAQASGVKISDVLYRNIQGTSGRAVA
ncbi:unnamed protein product [Prunus armeniaca]|uniref:Pectate lyase superfamily protein domain-containing protein n=1 Tax=Prunus armeniaca TaxID=36596 RepID=A0A6J5XV37_PRUAR|nr:unnamed protein product [Prunus armeniaca]